MIEALGSSVVGVLALTITLIILTFPTWIAGKIVARRTRALPVPVFLRPRLARWALWYFAGIIALLCAVLATRPSGTFDGPVRILLAGSALAAYAVAAVTGFYISWTASAQRRARRERDRSDPVPFPQGMNQENESGQSDASTRNLPPEGATRGMCAPAQRKDVAAPEYGSGKEGDSEYKPARPTE